MTSRTTTSRNAPTLLLLTSLTLLAPPADALSQIADLADPEGSAYGRIRYLEGEVTATGLQGERTGESLGLNSPILPGDQLATADGRVELQLADGSLVRLDRLTLFEASVLADEMNTLEKRTWLVLHGGSVFLYVDRLQGDESFRLDTPAGSIYLLTEGVFRIDVASTDGRTTVSSHSGVAEILSDGFSVLVRSGERSDVAAGAAASDPRPFSPFTQDDFDRWNRLRQAAYVKPYRSLPAAEVPEAVQPYVTELAYYGEWTKDARYGWIWRPPASGGDWAPYLVGHWDYAPSGWIWVSYEPWGWAPYHYGRWEFAAGAWFWIPGSVYSGAWVSWAWSPGTLGWCPLNYYNRPAVEASLSFQQPYRTWVFVPQQKIHHANLHLAALSRYQVEPARVHPLDRRPTANPVTVARASGVNEPPAGTSIATPAPSGELVSFQTLEGGGRYRLERGAPRAASPPSATRTVRTGSRAAPSSPVTFLGVRIQNPPPPPPGRQSPPGRDDPRTVVRAPAGSPAQTGAPSAPTADGTAQAPSAAPPPGERDLRVIQLDDRRGILRRIFTTRSAPSSQQTAPTQATTAPGPPAGATPAGQQGATAKPATPPPAAANRAPQSGATGKDKKSDDGKKKEGSKD